MNCVAPGWVASELTSEPPRWYVERSEQHAAMRRFAQPEEVAGAVVSLLSDAAGYATGSVIDVRGGYGMWSLNASPPEQGG